MSRSLLFRPVEIPRPVSYWNMNDDFVVGSQLVDVMGANNGTILGGVTTGVGSRAGQAFLFDGSATAEVTIPDSPDFESHIGPSGVLTLSAVIRWDGTGSGLIISKDANATSSEREFQFLVQQPSNALAFFVGDNTATNRVQIDTLEPIPLGVQTHVAVTYDASQANVLDKITLYINGERKEGFVRLSAGSFTQISSSGTRPLRIGSVAGAAGTEFEGLIDEVVWFPTVLNDAQIAELSARSLRGLKAFANPPATDYSIWWSSRNVDGQGNSTVTNAAVQTLTDTGSVGVNATQGTLAKRPHLLPLRNNGRFLFNEFRAFRPGLKFDGVDDVLNFLSQTLDDYTIFLLVEPRTTQNSSSLSPILTRTDGLNPRGSLYFGNFSSALNDEVISVVHIDGGGTTRAFGTTDPGLAVLGGKTNLIVAALEDSNPLFRLNGVDLGPAQQGSSGGLNSESGFSLQNIDVLFGRDTGPTYTDGILYELLIYSRRLTSLEILQVESFLAEEYPGVESQFFASTVAATPEGAFPDPFAYYSFNNADLVSNTLLEPFRALTGSLINSPTTGVAGQSGQAFSFTGASSQRVEIVDNPLFDFELDQPFSISSWFSTSSNTQWLLGKLRTGASVVNGWGIFMTAGGNLQVVLGNLSTGRIVTTIDSYDDGVFHNVIITYDGTNSAAGITVFVDSVEVSTSITLDTDPGTIINNLPVQIGSQGPSASIPGYWTGLIDETAFWDVQLT